MSETVGASFRGFTVTLKVMLLDPNPASITVSVIAAAPVWSRNGVSVRFRLVGPPLMTTLFAGNNCGLDELICRLKLLAVVSASRTLKGINGLVESSFMLWFPMNEIVGRTLAEARIVTKKVCVTLWLTGPVSLTTTLTTEVPVALFCG